VLNCTIVSNGANGIHLRSSTFTTIANNILAFNASWGAYDEQNYNGTDTAQSNCVYLNYAGDFRYVSDSSGNISANPCLVDLNTCNVQLDFALSPCVDTGRIGDLDPDGTRADIGAWGGPGAARFWPYPEGGPVITSIEVEPASVAAGGTITIRATGEIR